jgi:hypothetical protein
VARVDRSARKFLPLPIGASEIGATTNGKNGGIRHPAKSESLPRIFIKADLPFTASPFCP